MRTAPIGPSNGMPEIISAAEAALIASTSCGFSWSAPSTVSDDLGLVAEAVGERRAQRAVGEPAGEDRVLGRTALTTEERTGDLAGGVRTLLDVDRQGEEVDAGTHVLGGVGGGEHDGARRCWPTTAPWLCWASLPVSKRGSCRCR